MAAGREPSRPEAWLLDARVRGLDEAGLRAWARHEGWRRGAGRVTRSYRFPFALVARHLGPVGVDIERIEPLGAGFADSIATPAERAGRIAAAPDAHVTSVWSGKEALSKALGDALRYDPRRLESPLSWPDGRAGPWRAQPLPAPQGHTAWLCWLSAPARGAAPATAGPARRRL